jgi:hypothetical protein
MADRQFQRPAPANRHLRHHVEKMSKQLAETIERQCQYRADAADHHHRERHSAAGVISFD